MKPSKGLLLAMFALAILIFSQSGCTPINVTGEIYYYPEEGDPSPLITIGIWCSGATGFTILNTWAFGGNFALAVPHPGLPGSCSFPNSWGMECFVEEGEEDNCSFDLVEEQTVYDVGRLKFRDIVAAP